MPIIGRGQGRARLFDIILHPTAERFYDIIRKGRTPSPLIIAAKRENKEGQQPCEPRSAAHVKSTDHAKRDGGQSILALVAVPPSRPTGGQPDGLPTLSHLVQLLHYIQQVITIGAD